MQVWLVERRGPLKELFDAHIGSHEEGAGSFGGGGERETKTKTGRALRGAGQMLFMVGIGALIARTVVTAISIRDESPEGRRHCCQRQNNGE